MNEMDLNDEIQNAIKSKRVVIGFRGSIKAVKTGSPKIVVIASNLPPEMKKEIESGLKSEKTRLEIFNGSSRDLGVLCGKPFPVAALAITG